MVRVFSCDGTVRQLEEVGYAMSNNPYDDYDAFDPLADEEEEGNFEYVEDDLGYTDNIVGEGFDAPEYVPAASDLPKTMVRKRPLVQEEASQSQDLRSDSRQGGGILRRVRGRKRQRREEDPLADRYVGVAPVPSPPQAEPRPEPSPARRPPRTRRRRGRGRRRHGCLFTLLVLAVVFTVGAYWAVAHPIDEQLAFSPQEQQSVNGTTSWSIPGMPYYVLALGSDAQEGTTGARSDTMMLIRVDLLGGKLTMLSIPRDTKVELDGYGTQKINAAYAFEGPGGAVRAVSKLTGVGINHVAVVHLSELAGLVEYLGGVTVNVPEAAYDPDHTGIDIDSGLQTLDGDTAVAWARTRYGYERGDFQRQEDQRILLEAIMNRMLSLSPRQMPGAIREVGGLIGTDMRCYDLVPLLLRFKLSNPTVYSCSVPSTTATIDGVSYVIADEAALASMMRTINAGGDPNA